MRLLCADELLRCLASQGALPATLEDPSVAAIVQRAGQRPFATIPAQISAAGSFRATFLRAVAIKRAAAGLACAAGAARGFDLGAAAKAQMGAEALCGKFADLAAELSEAICAASRALGHADPDAQARAGARALIQFAPERFAPLIVSLIEARALRRGIPEPEAAAKPRSL